MLIMVEENEKNIQDITEFPCVMISTNGEVCLITGEDDGGTYIGTNINGKINPLGEYSEYYKKSEFRPWNGTITISNIEHK